MYSFWSIAERLRLLGYRQRYDAVSSRLDSHDAPSRLLDKEEESQTSLTSMRQSSVVNVYQQHRAKFLFLGALLLLMLAYIPLGYMLHRSYHSQAPLTVVPEIPNIIRAFDHDWDYVQSPTRDGGKLNATWDALLPPGRGFVRIQDHEKWKVTTGLPTGDGDARFSISMFHQLHCLDYVRQTIYEIILKVQEGRRDEIEISEIDQLDHIPHCLDYVRQGIMCAGDTSIEGARYDRHRTVVFGIGNPHLCKDFDAIYNFAAEHAEQTFER